MKNTIRTCKYTGKQNSQRKDGDPSATYYFHRWFEEGSTTDGEGGIDIGAILETHTGEVLKVWDVNEIRFLNRAEESS